MGQERVEALASPYTVANEAAAPRVAIHGPIAWLVGRPSTFAIVLLILAAGVRLVLMNAIGFGNDEAYTLVGARDLHLSYFDHPPLHVWFAHLASRIFGETSWVRLPTVLLFAGTGWLMFALTRDLFGPSAGLWALAALNMTPFFTVSAGGWIVPDGPLSFFLLAGVRALGPVLFQREGASRNAWCAWLLAGLCLGLAGLSKYTAAFAAVGLLGFVATSPRQRRWLRHPAPYAGGIAALLAVSPTLVWNAQHHWVSFAFQGTRGLPRTGLHPVRVLAMVAGECALLSPWIVVPATISLAEACDGRGDERRRLMAWLSVPAILFFSVAPLWSARGLPHWPMPGWLFAFPLLGEWLAAGRRRWLSPPVWAIGSASAFVAVLAIGVFVATFGLPWTRPPGKGSEDPTLEAFAWTALRDSSALRAMHADFVVTTRWMDAGKIAMALGKGMPVAVFSNDPRQFAFASPLASRLGHDAAIVVPARLLDETLDRVWPYFVSFDAAEYVWLGRLGRPELDLALVHAHQLRQPYPNPYEPLASPPAGGTPR